jgi:2,4-dienoyl-CoA reductase-like NADH-dependent reductase (Old Yellow Enzyme family)
LRGDAPRDEFAATLPWWLRNGFRYAGKRFLRDYPYEEAFFLDDGRRFREAVDLPLVLLGGISRLETAERALAEGFDFVGMARALLCEPDLPARWQARTATASMCTHCNKCIPTIYTGTRCVLDA